MWRVTTKGTLGPCYKLLVLYQFYSAISAAVFSSQEVQYNRMQAMTQHKLIMLCTDKGSMVHAQYCSEWTELGMVWHACSIPLFLPTWPMKEGETLIV